MELKGIQVEGAKGREKQKEDRKDERTKIQATQQSEMIEQRNSGKPPKNFESAGHDILGGGFDLGSFDPTQNLLIIIILYYGKKRKTSRK